MDDLTPVFKIYIFTTFDTGCVDLQKSDRNEKNDILCFSKHLKTGLLCIRHIWQHGHGI